MGFNVFKVGIIRQARPNSMEIIPPTMDKLYGGHWPPIYLTRGNLVLSQISLSVTVQIVSPRNDTFSQGTLVLLTSELLPLMT